MYWCGDNWRIIWIFVWNFFGDAFKLIATCWLLDTVVGSIIEFIWCLLHVTTNYYNILTNLYNLSSLDLLRDATCSPFANPPTAPVSTLLRKCGNSVISEGGYSSSTIMILHVLGTGRSTWFSFLTGLAGRSDGSPLKKRHILQLLKQPLLLAEPEPEADLVCRTLLLPH
jgi:hypothetical protein